MLVQVGVAVKHIAFRLHLGVAAGSSCFLDIVLQRIANVVVYHQPHILLVHAHPKCRSGHNDTCLSSHECILILHFCFGIHPAVEGECHDSVGTKTLAQLMRFPRPRHVYDGRAGATEDDVAQMVVLVVGGVGVDYRIAKVFSLRRCGKDSQREIQFLVEVVDDVADNLLLGSGSETRHGDRKALLFRLLQLLDEIADKEVVHPEVMAPSRETVGFVDDKTGDGASHQQSLDGF